MKAEARQVALVVVMEVEAKLGTAGGIGQRRWHWKQRKEMVDARLVENGDDAKCSWTIRAPQRRPRERRRLHAACGCGGRECCAKKQASDGGGRRGG